MTAEELIARLEAVKPQAAGGWIARCPAHEDRSPSLSIAQGSDRILLHCHAGCTAEAIVGRLNMRMADLFTDSGKRQNRHEPTPALARPGKVVASFAYHDELGQEVYRVDRIEPGANNRRKDFRQKRLVDGQYVYNMAGVKRVLFGLPAVMKAQEVWIAEGEGKAELLTRLGYTATCCAGGCAGWLDAYADYLAGKDVVICQDADEPGRKFGTTVHKSLIGKAASVRLLTMPKPHNDVVDLWREKGDGGTAETLNSLFAAAQRLTKGIAVPIHSMEELERQYSAMAQTIDTVSLRLNTWLPSLGGSVRRILPGEVIGFLADTGVGKTMLLQNLAIHCDPLTVLLFELELPGTLTFERFAAMGSGVPAVDVEHAYAARKTVEWGRAGQLRRIYTCSRSGLTMEDISELITQSELVIGRKPQVVMLDYLQLVKGAGSRYEKTSDAAEGVKSLAKEHNILLVIASQLHRNPNESSGEVHLHDGKDSGSIENSCGLLIGAWRHENKPDTMLVKVLKQTKGRANMRPVECHIDPNTLRITEEAPQWT